MRNKIIFAACIILAASCNQQGKEQVRYAAPAPTNTWKKIPKNASGEWFYRGTKFPAQPGDTIMVDPDYTYIEINDLHGSEGKPIVFIAPAGTKVGYKTAGNAMIIQRCSYLVFDGFTVGPDSGYAAQGWNIQSSHNIEIRNFILKNANIGFFTNPASGHFPNIYIHDGIVKNIRDKENKNFDEAVYIGRTSGQSLEVNSFPNLRIEDVSFDNIGGDAIQIANGVNVSVKRNKITNYGQNKINDQWFAILCGGGTSGVFEDNIITGGSGTPFQILGTGEVTFKNNTAINTGTGAANQDAFYIRQSFPTLRVKLIGNKVDRKSRNWITEVTPGLVVEDKGNVFGQPVPPPVVRVDSVSRRSYDSVLSLLTAATLWRKQTTDYINRP